MRGKNQTENSNQVNNPLRCVDFTVGSPFITICSFQLHISPLTEAVKTSGPKLVSWRCFGSVIPESWASRFTAPSIFALIGTVNTEALPISVSGYSVNAIVCFCRISCQNDRLRTLNFQLSPFPVSSVSGIGCSSAGLLRAIHLYGGSTDQC